MQRSRNGSGQAIHTKRSSGMSREQIKKVFLEEYRTFSHYPLRTLIQLYHSQDEEFENPIISKALEIALLEKMMNFGL